MIDPFISTLDKEFEAYNPHRIEPDLEVIRHLIDILLASRPNEGITDSLYSARIHVTRAISEVRNTAVAA